MASNPINIRWINSKPYFKIMYILRPLGANKTGFNLIIFIFISTIKSAYTTIV